jgi:Fe-S oxidoreductase
LKTDRPLRAVYHRPCHAGTGHRGLETALAAGEVRGLEIVATTDRCCGGMTSSSNPKLAFELSANIIAQAEKEGADTIVTPCIFCRDNLHRAARRKKSKLKVEHSLLFLARQFSEGSGSV